LLWIAFHIGRRPRPYFNFTVRDILYCRRFKSIDSYKRTSPRGPEAKHLRLRCTPINGVYAAGRLSSHSPFSQMYVRAAAERSLSGTPMHLLLVDAPNRAVHINGMFHARLEPFRAFVCSYTIDGILRISEKCSRPINGILSDTTSAFTDQPRLCCRKHHSLQHHPCFRAMISPPTPHLPTAMLKNTYHQHPRRPYYRQQAPGPTFCARLTIKRTSSLALPLPARF